MSDIVEQLRSEADPLPMNDEFTTALMHEAADEIERLRAVAPNQHGWAALSSPNVIVVYPYTVARPPNSALVLYRFDQKDPPRWADEGSDQ